MSDEMMSDYQKHLAAELADPEFRDIWEADEAEFQVRRAIIEARIATGLTQEQLAKASGINQRAISRIETGNANPTLRTLARLARGFGKKLEIRFI